MAHIQCNFYSPSLLKNANVMVFIPTTSADDYLEERTVDYYTPGKTYPTLYLLHGSYGDCTDWGRLANVERYAQDKNIAVVMPSAENSNYVNMDKGEPYLTYITSELPQFLSRIFPLSRERRETFIAGLSMGGYGAFRCAFECPETYGAAASLSGALDMQALQNSTEAHAVKMPSSYKLAVFSNNGHIEGTRNDLPELLSTQLKAGKVMPKLYMTCGTEDFIFASNQSFYNKVKDLEIDLKFEKHPGVHDWNFWNAHIQDVLNWLKW